MPNMLKNPTFNRLILSQVVIAQMDAHTGKSPTLSLAVIQDGHGQIADFGLS